MYNISPSFLTVGCQTSVISKLVSKCVILKGVSTLEQFSKKKDRFAKNREFHVNSNSDIIQIKENMKILMKNLTVLISHYFEKSHLNPQGDLY